MRTVGRFETFKILTINSRYQTNSAIPIFNYARYKTTPLFVRVCTDEIRSFKHYLDDFNVDWDNGPAVDLRKYGLNILNLITLIRINMLTFLFIFIDFASQLSNPRMVNEK